VLDAYQRAASVEEVRRRYGGSGRIIKLASNENPLGTSPKALAAARAVETLHLYGDDAFLVLKQRFAVLRGLAAENVVFGHGSNEIVKLVAETFLQAGDEAVIAVPSFALYRLAVAVRNARAVEVPLRGGVTDLDAMREAISPRTKLIFVCEPNNPTGTGVDPLAWSAFVEALPAHVVLVVDQAYREYASAASVDAIAHVTARPRTLVLRTMSKIYGLAAVRFGYGFADAETIAVMERVRLPFNVSAPALAAAAAALDDDEFVRRSIENNEAGKAQLFPALAALELDAYPTQANFYALAVRASATRAYEDLLREGIIVRCGDALRMPGRLRITIGTEEENAMLLRALERLVGTWRA
jgi:histidinol-phosphate aminotransferase